MAKILVIDNEQTWIRDLKADGHEVVVAQNPLLALQSVARGQDRIDLLLTNVETKPISGFEVVKRLTEKGFDGSVLFMSESPALVAAVSQALGKHSILAKPFAVADLRAAIRTVAPDLQAESPRAA